MTVKELLFFQCVVCKITFMSYVRGKYISSCAYENYHEDGICFYDNELGEIHNNHYLNTVKDVRKCRKCRVSHQLEEYLQ